MMIMSAARRRSLTTLASLTSRRSIILAGAAGCGKTTVGRILAQRLGRQWIDVDDHVLEPCWRHSVADKLAQLGDTAFLEAEAEATRQFVVPDASVVSLSGSNPLDPRTIRHLSKSGVIFYLDYPLEAIEARLQQMQVNRIVGQAVGKSIGAILAQRACFYDVCYDVRLTLSANDTPEDIADLVLHAFDKSETFVSTRGHDADETLAHVLRKGVAPDRGLYVPKRPLAPWSLAQLARLTPLDFKGRLRRVLEYFPLAPLHPSALGAMVGRAYDAFEDPSQPLPLRQLKENIYLQETYHGPTASFKDLALQFTPRLMSWAAESKSKMALLVATSGDTGVAAMDGFAKAAVPTAVLYPIDGVSIVQRHQMLAAADNTRTRVFGVDADFDFCQMALKEIFSNPGATGGFKLSAGNSMNWGRLVPQTAYALSSYLDLVAMHAIALGDPIDVVVPTGNFGHVLGMYMAKKVFGVPIRRFICASNENDVVAEFLSTGVYDLRHRILRKTRSPSVDILLSSNVERLLYYLSDGDAALVAQCFDDLAKSRWFKIPPALLVKLRAEFTAMACSDNDCLATIAQVYDETRALIDPHTALGVFVAQKLHRDDVPMVVSATAHFAKFPAAVLTALNLNAGNSVPEVLRALEAIETTTPMHSALRRCMLEPTPAFQRRLPANMGMIRSEISTFLKEQQIPLEQSRNP